MFFQDHIKSVHENSKEFQCDRCQDCFSERRLLDHHVKTIHENLRDFKCTVCNKGFWRKRYLVKHTKQVHEKRLDEGEEIQDSERDIRMDSGGDIGVTKYEVMHNQSSAFSYHQDLTKFDNSLMNYGGLTTNNY